MCKEDTKDIDPLLYTRMKLVNQAAPSESCRARGRKKTPISLNSVTADVGNIMKMRKRGLRSAAKWNDGTFYQG